MELLIILVIVIPLNLLLWLLSTRYIAKIYHKQFKNLVQTINGAMAQRDAEVAKYKALFTQDLIRDGGGAFDTALEDLTDLEEVLEEEITNERKADSSDPSE